MKLIKLVLIGVLASILGITSCKKEEAPDLNSSLDDLAFDKLLTKYSLSEIGLLAELSGFTPIRNFTDPKNRFVDVLWKR